MKAIETHWNGYTFRSRLEARWAVFFQAMHWPYHYEPEGFVLADGTGYLPDFYLPTFDVWVEIKGQHPTGREERIAVEWGRQGKAYYILYGPCSPEEHGVYFFDPVIAEIQKSPTAVFAGCRRCGEGVWIQGEWFATPWDPCPDTCKCEHPPMPTQAMLAAYALAKSARFEHGEKGAVRR